ncbi:MAG: hypothetical protein WCC11_09370 [Gammaproteobacteria bacterium]
MKKLIVTIPVILTALLLAWTGAVYRFSDYGSWYIYPALVILPVTIAYHLALIILRTPRRRYVLYAFIHLAFLIPIWFACLMLISKDSL